jgi:outer membrane protein W
MWMLIGRVTLTGVAAAAALGLNSAPAAAQVETGDQEVSIYAGQLFGDDLTDRKVSGRTPKLDDDVTYGVRYSYNVTGPFAVELSLGETATSVTNLVGRDIDLDLTTLDLDAVWNFNAQSRFVPYVVAGFGYATANLDSPIRGTVKRPGCDDR